MSFFSNTLDGNNLAAASGQFFTINALILDIVSSSFLKEGLLESIT
ncbi:hypothetical protein [Pontibacter vulgaris]|nr:hypothetical protein [Pontibacter vulgaris]